LSGSVTITSSTCEQANGQVTVNTTGGFGAMNTRTYSLNGGAYQVSNIFSNLTPGNHSVTIRDSLNCTKTISFFVPTTLVPIVNDIPNVVQCDNYVLPNITGTNLTGNEGYYTGTNGTGATYTPGSIISSSVTLYIHDSTSTVPTCRDQETFNITINNAPLISNIVRTCNGSTDYTVSFQITGGTGTYTIQELAPGTATYTVTGSSWTSNPIPSNTPYDFDIDDANGCGPVKVSGVRNCFCPTATGTMASTTIRVCGTGAATGSYSSIGEFNDGNDVLSFVLHTQAGSTLGTILQTSSTPTFSFGSGMSYGTTYYISALMGNNNGAGGTDLTDPCLSVASGQPVIWNEIPTASISGGGEICLGNSSPVTFNLTGVGPFTVTYNNGSTNTNLSNLNNGHVINLSPTQSRTYALVSVVSATTTCAGTVSPTPITITVNNVPSVSTPVYTCNSTYDGYTVSFTISGGSGNYFFNEPGVAYGGTISGNTFTSNNIPTNASFNIEIFDDKACGIIPVQGSHSCGCGTNSGTMDNQKIEICGPGNITANHNNTTMTLDGNDVLQFILHTGSSNTLGTILDTNLSTSFGMSNGAVYGTTYYISAVAGNNNGSGYVDLNDPCLSVSVGTPVEWKEIPNSTASTGNPNICTGDTLKLFATTFAGASYSWAGPNSYSSFSQNPIRLNATTQMTGSYILTAMSNGCSSSSSVTVTVNQRPNSTISNSPTGPFCSAGNNVQLNASSPGGTWSGTGIIDANQGTFSPSVAGPGQHVVTYSFGGSCPSSSNRTITVNQTPNADFSSDIQSGCSDLTVNFTASDLTNTSYSWNMGDGTPNQTASQFYYTFPSGSFTVSLTASKNGCTSTVSKNNYITVYQTPTANFSHINGENGAVIFDNQTTNANTYIWDFGDQNQSTEFSPEHQYASGGEYLVELIATGAGGCDTTYSKLIVVVLGQTIFIPNSFTPNSDEANPVFKPYLNGDIDFSTYQLEIFNRWGELVFQTFDPRIGWDGTYMNQVCEPGIYSYYIKFKSITTDYKLEKTGTITLLK